MKRTSLNKNDKHYTLNPFNNSPRIMLVDKTNDLIMMVSQIQAFHMIRCGFVDLQMIKPPTVQFKLERKEWDERFLNARPSHKFRISSRYLEERKSILYGNYRIQSPEGNEMFHCNAQKALWYLNRDIADVVTDNPPTLKLKFVPGGPGHIGDAYYLSEKINRCVVCGTEKSLNRHHVMPRVFRRYLPDAIKDHNYHDVLLMCLSCHENYEVEATKFKQEICRELGLQVAAIHSYTYLPEVGRAIKSARALLNNGDKIPEPRKMILLNDVRIYLKKEDITKSDLKDVTSHFSWQRPDDNKSYGQYVVEKIGDLQEFTNRWRRHFISVMNPQYLPEHWDVDKPLVKDRVRSKSHPSPMSEEALEKISEAPRANETNE